VQRVELHYLSVDNHGFDIDLADAIAILDENEKSRYRKFSDEKAQQSFLQARRIVKTSLAKKLRCSPSEIIFSYSGSDKPFLPGTDAWNFNISHSHSSIVVAVSGSPVGVDVEDVDRCIKIYPKAKSFLNSHVKQCVEKTTTEYGAAAIFAEHWSCAESYTKLKGSTIYREKSRVKMKYHSTFSGGKRFTYNETHFTVFDFSQVARISVAVDDNFPEVDLLYWRTGNQKRYPSE